MTEYDKTCLVREPKKTKYLWRMLTTLKSMDFSFKYIWDATINGVSIQFNSIIFWPLSVQRRIWLVSLKYK